MKLPNFLRGTSHTGWESLILSILGTTISIALTFGVNSWTKRVSSEADRKLAAVRVMANIESSARDLEMVHETNAPADTTANFILDHIDQLEYLSTETLQDLVFSSAPTGLVTYDKSVEQIFTSSFDIWRNVDNGKFIDMAGESFHMMDIFSEEYNSWVEAIIDYADNYMYDHSDLFKADMRAYYLSYLRAPKTQRFLEEIHLRQDRLCYVAAVLRWYNRQSMELMGVSQEEVWAEVADSKTSPTGEPIPNQDDFVTPAPHI